MKDALLLCVTETTRKEAIDNLVAALDYAASGVFF
jgi:glycine cleavage system pyridoxal-binding protein P